MPNGRGVGGLRPGNVGGVCLGPLRGRTSWKRSPLTVCVICGNSIGKVLEETPGLGGCNRRKERERGG